MADSGYDALSQASPITIPSEASAAESSAVSSLNAAGAGGFGYGEGRIAATPAVLVEARANLPARSVISVSSSAQSTGSQLTRERAARARARAERLERQAIQEDADERERELMELGVVEDVESFERLNPTPPVSSQPISTSPAAPQSFPTPTTAPQIFPTSQQSSISPQVQAQIDSAAEVIRQDQQRLMHIAAN